MFVENYHICDYNTLPDDVAFGRLSDAFNIPRIHLPRFDIHSYIPTSVLASRLSSHYHLRIKDNNPQAKKPSNVNQWNDAIRLMIESDGYTKDKIEKMIQYCQSDDFWKSNILSAKKLREKAGTLILQMDRGSESGRVKTNSKKPIVEVAKFEGYNENIISDERMEEIRIKARQYEESRMRALP